MLYFAYGSNMCLRRLRSRVPSSEFYAVASLKGYTLKFHKKSTDGSGKCNAFQTNNSEDRVVGVIFEISKAEKSCLDNAEGVGKGYTEQMVELESSNGVIKAYMYIANSDAINDTLIPYTWYKDFVVEGARQYQLPVEYIRSIETVEAKMDSDEERERQNREQLPCS